MFEFSCTEIRLLLLELTLSDTHMYVVFLAGTVVFAGNCSLIDFTSELLIAGHDHSFFSHVRNCP